MSVVRPEAPSSHAGRLPVTGPVFVVSVARCNVRNARERVRRHQERASRALERACANAPDGAVVMSEPRVLGPRAIPRAFTVFHFSHSLLEHLRTTKAHRIPGLAAKFDRKALFTLQGV